MVEITLATVIARGSDHVEAQMSDQTVMMSVARGKYFALEGTAQRIWELVAEPMAVGEVVDRLVGEFEIDRDQCAAEVISFVRELLGHGLMVERRP